MPLLSSTHPSDNRTAPCIRDGRRPVGARAVRRPDTKRFQQQLRSTKPIPPTPERGTAQAYPCHDARPLRRKTREEQGTRIDLPACPSHARRTKAMRSQPPCPRTGTCITTIRCPKNSPRPTAGRIRRMRRAGAGDGVPFETAGSTAQATTGRPAPPPGAGLVGLGRLERPTSRLSGVRSNQLSYRPESHPDAPHRPRAGDGAASRPGPAVVRRDVQTAAGHGSASCRSSQTRVRSCTRRRGPVKSALTARCADADSWGALERR